ncbi:hypothetical protein COS31_01575 [Candidatus Roizmanbacteria bacterium CG02_land_8_20_14_3_00_36_15]|uniref:rRNA maturation RNase YbeY n=2 Tax=Candidatus Roizmaniibacteriota TaxID=1752723 RepID=A0A2M8KKW7_9BACT|nr:MAG: hypothetical protein COS51_05490 [Candidatus Roizmanbacteria bacterium CG03_land_8_20_14_0_80_36_21]PIV37993.1 MAG: hypothetical protein COS31_01575 [Candidatus Roizmanbacteria bacterium CG02_land_8_20_14_3_00_36_15]PIY70131.1 MAG: hypothetical protein COY89_02800 [Candidatus Roizmanbacteria bacterium CG_4_10_14_0_8_um_filter_36_36]PJA52823.1 MAG: hypothetical protein CO166_04105 [Candidatus Roizmanbacteria bacterium CG_4_9_14_3_um_filter_36_11]PJC81219.1 MAG: hypothetical protein CO007
MVNIVCPGRYKIDRHFIGLIASEFLQKLGVSSSQQLNIIFVGRNKMKSIAFKYKKEKLAIPILSFPYDREKDNLVGEVFICYPQAVLLAAERNKRVDQILKSLIEHGIENIIK